MIDARRTYAYLVSAISLAAIFGALTWFLRGLLVPTIATTTLDTALQLAILIIGVPIYLGHWLWQQRLAAKNAAKGADERAALGRRIYLYAVMTASVIVVATSSYYLAAMMTGVKPAIYADNRLELHYPLYSLIPIVLAVALWAYHYLLLRAERGEVPETGQAGTVRRLHIYLLSAFAATQVAFALVELLRWLFSTLGLQLGDATPVELSPSEALATIIIYLPLWLTFWRWANQLFAASNEERESVLRKFYLYGAILIGTIGTVSTLALLMAGFFRQLLDLPPEGTLAGTLAVLITFALLWIFHSFVIREDLRASEDTAQQAEMRRLYLYLVAAVGLVALIGGAISEIWLFIDSSSIGLGVVQKEQLAYSTAAILAGLPLWFIAWRQAQIEAGRDDAVGEHARRSSIRKVYIYFFQFASIMAVLGSAIFVVSQGVNWLLTQDPIDMEDIALPLAISVVNVLVWLFHWRVLHTDRALTASNEIRQLDEMGIVLIQKIGDSIIPAIYERLRGIAPNLQMHLLRLDDGSTPQPETMEPTNAQGASPAPTLLEQLLAAQTIVAPSTLLALGEAANPLERVVAQAMIASPARKLLLPVTSPEWLWVGAEPLQTEKVAQEAVETLRQLARGEKVQAHRKFGCGMIVLSIVCIIVLPSLLYQLFFLF